MNNGTKPTFMTTEDLYKHLDCFAHLVYTVYTTVYTKREKGDVLEKKKQLHFTVTA